MGREADLARLTLAVESSLRTFGYVEDRALLGRFAHSRTDRGTRFYAGNYQQYLAKNPYGYRCHANTGAPFPSGG